MAQIRRSSGSAWNAISSPVTFEITPDSVSVERLVHGRIILDQKSATLNAIIVQLALFDAPGPCKFNGVPARLFHFIHSVLRNHAWLGHCVSLHQLSQQ